LFRRILLFFCFTVSTLVILPLAGCLSEKVTPDVVTLQLNWIHATEFVGYYVAEAKGFYRDANITPAISEGGPGISARSYILNGKADFAIAAFDEQKNYIEKGKPSIAVMCVFQVPPLVLFALADSGIKEPKDLVGKRIGIKNSYWRDVAHQTLTNAGIDPALVTEIDVPTDAQSMLYEHKVDVWMGYVHDEPVLATINGYKVNRIYPADYGVGGYEGLLLVNENDLNNRPDLVGRFVRASQKGLQYALEHPDEAAGIILKWQPRENLEYYKLAVRALIPLVDIPQSKIGMIDPVRWAQLMGPSYNLQRPGYSMQFLEK
jgi:ABC-type nitrate/sulfonate/bicarbonate transport system substrate-binding protein